MGGAKLPYSVCVWRRMHVLRRLKIEVDFPRRTLVIFCIAINILYICSWIRCVWNYVILLLNRNDLKEYRMGSKSSLLSAKLALLHLLAKLATLEASASSSASQSYPIVELLCISIVAHLVNYLQLEKVNTTSQHCIWRTIPVGYSRLSAIKTGFCLLWPHRYVGWSTIWQFSWVREKNTNPEPLVPWQGKRSDVKLCESLISNSVKQNGSSFRRKTGHELRHLMDKPLWAHLYEWIKSGFMTMELQHKHFLNTFDIVSLYFKSRPVKLNGLGQRCDRLWSGGKAGRPLRGPVCFGHVTPFQVKRVCCALFWKQKPAAQTTA